MQLINHKNPALTTCERLFIEKSLELLHLGSIDSYRVRFHNPKSVLAEIKYCLEQFQAGRIKHFHTIKAKEKDKKAHIDEAIALLEQTPNYLTFSSISKEYVKQLLLKADEHNYKKVISAIDLLMKDNHNYVLTVFGGLEALLAANDVNLPELEKMDVTLDILFSELISQGFSKGFLYKQVYGFFVNSLSATSRFADHFRSFKSKLLQQRSTYEVVFRIDTTPKVYEAISVIPSDQLTLTDNIDEIHFTGRTVAELNHFNVHSAGRKFIRCTTEAADYLTALKRARSILSEYLDVINLGLSGEALNIHNRALVIDSRAPQNGQFQNNINILDGKYRVEKEYYRSFTLKLPTILNSPNVEGETKEKIKSAIRYLRLGNQSTEVEHKFINYWIGLEYLFSNYESQNTINRLKDHFINAHALAYVKRNLYSFKHDFARIATRHSGAITAYTPGNYECLKNEVFYTEVGNQLLNTFPLLAYRSLKLRKWLFQANKQANATDYLKKHRSNLEIHFTRIYRLRNEIIHDAATNTNNEHIASNLRYYLTFILNELIDFFSRNIGRPISIEDYFIRNEIELGNIEQGGYLLEQLLSVDCSIEFIS